MGGEHTQEEHLAPVFEPEEDAIWGFSGEFRFLSNFSPAPVILDGVVFPTVEHAYQAAKTLDPSTRTRIRACFSPGMAKRVGQTAPLRPDWEELKLDVMRDLLVQKFSLNAERWALLKATKPRQIVEANWWGDTFWGVFRGRGWNHLGRLLMEIRDDPGRGLVRR